MNFIKSIILGCILPLIAQVSLAQVVIGSSEKPQAGALLDLKERKTIGSNSNSTKGLLMPRVRLTEPKDITADIKGVTDANKDSHIALTVYNVNDFGFDPVQCPGLYVWSGEEWVGLQTDNKPKISTEGLPTLQDSDGNTYHYNKFGNQYWMVSNLRTTLKKDGTPITGSLYLNPAYRSGDMEAPDPSPPVVVNSKADLTDTDFATYVENTIERKNSYNDFATRFGLLYTKAQALEACPNNWRLPTQEDYMELAEYLGGVQTNNPNVNNGNPVYSGISKVLKANDWGYTSTDKTVVQTWGGYSVCAEENSGFSVYPVGCVSPALDARLFGVVSFLRTSSNSPTNANYGMYVSLEGHARLSIVDGDNRHHLSVRCIRE